MHWRRGGSSAGDKMCPTEVFRLDAIVAAASGWVRAEDTPCDQLHNH